MKQANVSVWFEIPAADLDRAARFYETVFGIPLRREAFGPFELAVFPHAEDAASGCLIHGDGFSPSEQGTVTYLNLADDLAIPLERAAQAGGAVLLGKTALPSGGYFARIRDCEGNRVGLFSPH